MHIVHNKWRKPRHRMTVGRNKSLRKAWQVNAVNNAERACATQAASAVAARNAIPNQRSRSDGKINRFTQAAGELSDEEYFLVSASFFKNLVSAITCPKCKTQEVEFLVRDKKRFSQRFIMQCSVCGTNICDSYPSGRVKQLGSSRPSFEVNKKMTTAFLDIGAGHSAMMRFCSAMGMNGLEHTAFYQHMHKLQKETQEMKKTILEQSREAVCAAHKEVNPSLNEESVLDILVSIDGSWHRRGHTSLFGFVAAIDVLTGLVVDFEILSKYCLMCSLAVQQYDQDSDEFKSWKQEHTRRNECSINFTEASGNMESAGALLMFQRSVENSSMRYGTFLSDGDAKTLSTLNQAKPYGPDFLIQKEECINHVSKRMGTALRNLVQDNKKSGNSIGGRGKGALTEVAIRKLQGYYHRALVSNVSDVKKMRRAILATIYHCAATDQKPNHSYCPAGKESWCFFNKKKAAKSKGSVSHEKMPLQLNEAVFNAVLPVYKRLSSDELLTRCTKGQTQNANESLHSVIWKKCPKHIFISKARMEIGITQRVGEFNMGSVALSILKSTTNHESIPKVTLALAAKRDQKRMTQSAHQEEVISKRQRVMKKHEKKKSNKNSLYAPGAGD